MKREMQQETIRKKPSFFKLMLPSPEISKQLQIPSEFIQHIHKSAFEKATVIDHTGRAWPVKFHENKKGVFVKDGWDRFFHDHSLGHFEFLVFIYDGKTRFRVKIFGKDGLEKVFPIEDYASIELMSLEHCSDENKSVEEVVCVSPPREEAMAVNGRRKRGRPRKNNVQKKAGKAVPRIGSKEFKQLVVMKSTKDNIERQITDNSSDKQLVSRIENDKVFQSNAKPDGDIKKRGRPIGSKTRKRGQPTGSKNKMIEGQSLVCEEPEYSKKKEVKKCSKNKEIKEEIIEISDEEPGFRSKKTNRKEARDDVYAKNTGFCSSFPFLERWIDLNNVNKHMMKLPITFAEKYLPKTHTEMVLTNEDGKSWTVNFVPLPHYYRFCGGWVHFMRDNELKLGDLCIFELISENCMKVHISRSEKTK